MNANMKDLYQEVILDHAKHPRNQGKLADATGHADGFNPLCGDEIHIDVVVQEGRIQAVRFEGHGCAVSTASASLLAEQAQGMDLASFEALFGRVHDLVTGVVVSADDLGKLEALGGVARFPMRVKCAILPWHAIRAALKGDDTPVSTE